MNELSLFLQLSVQLGTPFLLGTLGGILCEKVGNLNLGIEGMMILGAFSGFAAGFHTHSVLLAVLAAMAGGVGGALIYAVITVTLKGNQTVTGFALTIFGTGFANFMGKRYSSQIMDSAVTAALGTHSIPGLSKIPVLGTAVFSQSLFVYFSILVAAVLCFYYQKTRFGLAARMVGESPARRTPPASTWTPASMSTSSSAAPSAAWAARISPWYTCPTGRTILRRASAGSPWPW